MPMVGVEREIAQVSKHTCTKRYQDNKGFYHYKNENLSWNDTKDSKVNLTFESNNEERKGQLIDPVWKSEMRSQTSASGRGRTVRPLDRTWEGLEFSGSIRGKETTEFSWRLNLENLEKK
ncbi:MAG: hypothetical protein GQ559_02125 [Desulfobulbaceae bacterium]|nr:hypothetical protein [Desulfobulbaceae bacterium]